MKVPYVNLGAQHHDLKEEILSRISALLDSGQFILGDEVTAFENEFAKLSGCKYGVGVGNGTDALYLTMIAAGIGPGDEVITAPNSYLASASSIALAGAEIRFSDVAADYNLDPEKLEASITAKTKAVVAVHLTGRPAEMEALVDICNRHGLILIEDCAQAVGAQYKNQSVGSFGIAGCFSLHPLKNLSACGDAGIITTNDETLYKNLCIARNHGLENRDSCIKWSYNSRLDNLQAAILNVKLRKLSDWTARRRQIASRYRNELASLPLYLPEDKEYTFSVYHTYIIRSNRRDELKSYLEMHGVDTKIHYPISIYRQKAAENLPYKPGDFPETDHQTEEILSLPVFPELTDEQVTHVIQTIKSFFNN